MKSLGAQGITVKCSKNNARGIVHCLKSHNVWWRSDKPFLGYFAKPQRASLPPSRSNGVNYPADCASLGTENYKHSVYLRNYILVFAFFMFTNSGPNLSKDLHALKRLTRPWLSFSNLTAVRHVGRIPIHPIQVTCSWNPSGGIHSSLS